MSEKLIIDGKKKIWPEKIGPKAEGIRQDVKSIKEGKKGKDRVVAHPYKLK